MLPPFISTLKRRAPRLRSRPPRGYRPEPMPRIRWYSWSEPATSPRRGARRRLPRPCRHRASLHHWPWCQPVLHRQTERQPRERRKACRCCQWRGDLGGNVRRARPPSCGWPA